jgi:hypothetical protein
MQYHKLLMRPIAFQPIYVDLTGCHKAAIFLSQALYWHERAGKSGWFYKTCEQWQIELKMPRDTQLRVRKILKDLGLLREKHGTVQDTTVVFYQVDTAALDVLLGDYLAREQGHAEPDTPPSQSALPPLAKLDTPPSQNSLPPLAELEYIHRLHTETIDIDYTYTTGILPKALQTEIFLKKFETYWQYRKQKKLSQTEAVLRREIKTIQHMSPEVAAMCIDQTMGKGYQKLFSIYGLDKLHHAFFDCMAIYENWYKDKAGVIPPKADAKAMAALNRMLVYLDEAATAGGPISHVFAFILNSHDKWEAFYQKQVKLDQIEKFLPNILMSLKNGKQQQHANGGGKINVADVLQKASAMFGG